MKSATLNSALFFLAALVVCSLFILASNVNFVGADATTAPTVTEGTFKDYTFFATSTAQTDFATSTTATSTNIIAWFNANGERDNGSFVIAGAKDVTFYFDRTGANGNQGSSTFRIQVTPKTSPSESDWYYFNDMISATSTNTYATDIVLAATSTSQVAMDLANRGFYAARVIVVETTDGEHSASATATY